MIEKNEKIYIAGHRGLVGSAILKALSHAGYTNLVYQTHAELDLTQQQDVWTFFKREKPAYVFLAAAKVGGIHANNAYRADFIYQNLAIQLNVMEAARQHQVKRLLFLGSSCIYPRHCPQPMQEEHLLTSLLEPTNEPYAIAKIAGIKLCESYNAQYKTNFISVMPANLYGPHDNFDLETSHVIPALMRKAYEAKQAMRRHITVWGTGLAAREFLYVDDMASACLFVMNQYQGTQMINIGTGIEITIRHLAELICEVVGFDGNIIYDTSKPDGPPRKLLDVTRLTKLGWTAKTDLKQGLMRLYQFFLEIHLLSRSR